MSRGHKSSRTAAVLGAAIVGAATFAVTALAQDAPERKPVLHEDLTPPADGENRTAKKVRSDQQMFGAEPAIGQNPSAIESGEKIIPEPPTAQKRSGEEQVYGGTGPQRADRFTDYRPDLHTGTDGTLHYIEVFNPGIIPFKRVTALDAVDPDYTLTTYYKTGTQSIPVGGKPTENDELFWGSIVIELQRDTLVPLPSVSPDMRILSYEVTPSVQLEFSKDNADNFFVGSDEAGLDGKQYRLVFSVAVDRSYFSPAIPNGVQIRHLGKKPRDMHPAVVQRGLEAAATLRVFPRSDLKEALDRLVDYHRAFEAKPPPSASGDIFWSLFTNQAGVCRHRAFTFMVTANAVGIPARYVANEAHAWVEVWIPGNNWVRIDLGGAAMTLQVSNAEGKTMRPPDPDPFPKPANYNENYTRLEGDVQGLTGDQIAEAQTPSSYGSSDASGDSRRGDGADGDSGDGAFYDSDEADGPSDPGHMTGPGPGLPEVPAEELEGKIPANMFIETASPTGFRGETITVSGSVVTDEGEGIPKQRVDLFLAPQGLDGADSVLVGHTITASDGRWTAAVNLPRDLDLREYEVFASTPGDSKYQPTLSQ